MKKFYLAVNVLCSLVFAALIYVIYAGEYIRFEVFNAQPYDDFSPYLSGYASTQGLNNTVLESQFGFIYNLINGLAFNFLDFFNLGLNKLVFTSALFFFAIIVFVWLLIRIFTKYRIPYLFLLLSGILCVNLSGTSLPFNMLTGGRDFLALYNHNLWSLLYIHIALNLLIFKDRLNLKNAPPKDVYILAFIQSLFLYLTFNYKMNYFAPSFLLALSLIPFFTHKNILRYVIGVFVLFISASILTSLIFDYDYFVLLKVIKRTADAQKYFFLSKPAYIAKNTHQLQLAPFVVMVMASILNMNKIVDLLKKVIWGEGNYSKRLSDGIKGFCDKTLIETILFAAIIVGGIVIVIFGNIFDGGRMHIIPIFLCLFIFSEYKCKKSFFLCVCAFYFLWLTGTHITKFLAPKYHASDYKKVVVNNINPKHRLKFYISTMPTIKLDLIVNKEQLFDEMIQAYESLDLTKDDKILFASNLNYAPFVLNSSFPTLSYQIIVLGLFGPVGHGTTNKPDDADFYHRTMKTADIVIFMKEDNRLNPSDDAVYEEHFKAIEHNYRQLYETDNMIFYAKRSWIDERIYKGMKLPIIEKKGKGNIRERESGEFNPEEWIFIRI